MGTRLQLRTEVQGRSDDPNGAVAKVHEVNTWITLAVRAIWREWPWSFATDTATVTTMTDSALVTLPSTVQKPKRVYNPTTGTFLRPSNERTLQNAYPDAKGHPLYYCDGGLTQTTLTSPPSRRLRLFPTPDAAYSLTVTHLRSAPNLTSDEHYSPLPEEFDEAVVLWCLVRFYNKIDDIPQARNHQEAYREEVNGLKSTFSVFQHERFPTIVPESNDLT